jgi:hypothetical protein
VTRSPSPFTSSETSTSTNYRFPVKIEQSGCLFCDGGRYFMLQWAPDIWCPRFEEAILDRKKQSKMLVPFSISKLQYMRINVCGKYCIQYLFGPPQYPTDKPQRNWHWPLLLHESLGIRSFFDRKWARLNVFQCCRMDAGSWHPRFKLYKFQDILYPWNLFIFM